MSLAQIETTELGEVAEFVRGINFKPEDVVPESTPGVVACMRTKNVQAELDQSDVWFVGRQFVKRQEQMLSQGDILISSANSWNLVGKCCWIPDLPWESTFGGFVTVLRANRKKAFPRYLYHWFSSPHVQDFARSFGRQTTNISNLDIGRCLKMQIPVPPLSEQRRIAEILDRAEALRAKRRAALALLDELTQSIFLDMFGDPVSAPGTDTVTLEDVADLITGFAFKSSEFVQSGDSVRLCRGANVLPRTLDWSDVVFWPNDRVAEVDKFLLTPGDVIIAMDRPWISSGFKIAQVTAEDCPALLVQRVARLRGRTVTNNFLYELLKQPAFTRHCKPTETTVPHISPTDIRTFAFSMPSSEALRRFDARLATIAKIRSSVIESEVLSDQLFASLQHRAFRGEL